MTSFEQILQLASWVATACLAFLILMFLIGVIFF